AAQNDLHLALATFPREMAEAVVPVTEWDSENITCLRACVMKPEHLDWLPEILKRLRTAIA
ncbi:MAG TPA: aspartate aminotransferase family protein, partial [Acidobacteriota bacterium]